MSGKWGQASFRARGRAASVAECAKSCLSPFPALVFALLCACQPAPFIDWGALKNPILEKPDRCIKNQTVLLHEGKFWVFAFQRFDDGPAGPDTSSAGVFTTRDFREWETLEPPALSALSTSDVLDVDGGWHLVTQGAPSTSSGPLRLLHSTSKDLFTWETLKELAPQNEPTQRQIDGALAFADGHFWLGYKGEQDFYVMRSEGPELDGRWQSPQRASAAGEWAEAFHFIELDGVWHLVATGRDPKGFRCPNPYTCSHEPFIYRRDGDDWTKWVDKRQLKIQVEDWNREAHANGASLNDWRAHDGWYYLFYSGSNDGERFAGRGHCKLGVARSKNLVDWRLAGDTRE